MRHLSLGVGLLGLSSLAALGCGSDTTQTNPVTTGTGGATTTQSTGGHGPGSGGHSAGTGGSDQGGNGTGGTIDCGGSGPTGIKHVVVVIQENHTFDTYFGTYCKAAAGSNPTCNNGPTCCEANPATEPGGASPVELDDAFNAARDPSHLQACEEYEIDSGAMDHFVSGAGVSSCADPGNFAIAKPSTMTTYQGYAKDYAIADRYFQPIAGQSSSNDMYLAVAKEVFIDNMYTPDTQVGASCALGAKHEYTGETTIADLLKTAGKTVKFYAESYDYAKAALPSCPDAPAECKLHFPIYPCIFSPGDVPFLYYQQWADDPSFMQDFAQLAKDAKNDTLPDVSYVKAVGYHSEHPGYGTTITQGEAFVDSVRKAIADGCHTNDTLILVTWDEGGGYFDHVSPPPDSAVDNQPYGTRVPLIAIGPYAKKNFVSHTVMEHSSIVKFLEFLYLGGQTGQLGARDAVVNNIGSMLDETVTGMTIPDQ